MKILKINVKNYRNLSDLSIAFSPDCNFIVGENNIGKSNLLNLFKILFSNRSFDCSDFSDITKPIEIEISIKLSDLEIGHFEDLFDIDNGNVINIKCRQLNPDDNIEFRHLETDTFINSSIVRGINYIHYDSLRNPNLELNFDKGRGVGKFLVNMISGYLGDKRLTDKNFINETEIASLLGSINSKICRLKSFSDFKMTAESETDLESLLSRMVVLKDDKGGHLAKAGYGVQFLILITLSILEKIQNIKERKGDIGIFEDGPNNKKFMSIVIGLDEPEIHLHPYMQRSLIKYLNNVISNNNPEFLSLIKEIFDLDGFVGQIVIVTHSPNILLNDYKQIIRIYNDSGVIRAKSGSEIIMDPALLKHLQIRFLYFKEAFFSRCVIFIEGDSEEASLNLFAHKMSINFDDLGISVIQAHGNLGTIKLLVELASKFSIQSVGIGDKDNNAPVSPPLFITNKKDFEEEIISSLITKNESILRSIVKEFNGGSEDVVMQASALNKYAVQKYGVVTSVFTGDLKLSDIQIRDIDMLKSFYLTWFQKNKEYAVGNMIGEKIDILDIPQIYQTVINESVARAKI